jgi:hypothetical protein
MAAELTEQNEGGYLEVRVTGTLERQDYERFEPVVERLIGEHGKVRILVQMHDFHGWDAGALWEDIKFDARHFKDIERLALVGEKRWEQGMALFCKPFTTAKVRYFDESELETARFWIAS